MRIWVSAGSVTFAELVVVAIVVSSCALSSAITSSIRSKRSDMARSNGRASVAIDRSGRPSSR
jgi:hypothetical protein